MGMYRGGSNFAGDPTCPTKRVAEVPKDVAGPGLDLDGAFSASGQSTDDADRVSGGSGPAKDLRLSVILVYSPGCARLGKIGPGAEIASAWTSGSPREFPGGEGFLRFAALASPALGVAVEDEDGVDSEAGVGSAGVGSAGVLARECGASGTKRVGFSDSSDEC